jgi:hypothetical protein
VGAQIPGTHTRQVKGMGQRKCNPWSSRLRVGREGNDSTPEKYTVMKPWRRPTRTQSCSASKEDISH